MPSKNVDSAANLSCAVIVKTVDEKTRSKTSINELLRDYMIYDPLELTTELIKCRSVTPRNDGAIELLSEKLDRKSVV